MQTLNRWVNSYRCRLVVVVDATQSSPVVNAQALSRPAVPFLSQAVDAQPLVVRRPNLLLVPPMFITFTNILSFSLVLIAG